MKGILTTIIFLLTINVYGQAVWECLGYNKDQVLVMHNYKNIVADTMKGDFRLTHKTPDGINTTFYTFKNDKVDWIYWITNLNRIRELNSGKDPDLEAMGKFYRKSLVDDNGFTYRGYDSKLGYKFQRGKVQVYVAFTKGGVFMIARKK